MKSDIKFLEKRGIQATNESVRVKTNADAQLQLSHSQINYLFRSIKLPVLTMQADI